MKFEFEAALRYWTNQKRTKRLIVLMALDSLSDLDDDDASDTAALRQYLRLYKYTDYSRDDWLDNLLYKLPLQGMKRQNEGDDQLLVPVHGTNQQRQNEGDDQLLVPVHGTNEDVNEL